MSRCILPALALLAVMSAPSSAQYIGIFRDAEATSCSASPGSTPWIDLHVVAVLGGNVHEMTAAQFKIDGIPPNWSPATVLWVPNSAAGLVMGNPMFLGAHHPETPGVNIAFATCQSGNEGAHVPLGRVVLLGAHTPENVRLRVAGFKLVPTEPGCPMLLFCDFPTFTPVCVRGGEFVLNGPEPDSCAPMALDEKTWSGVKSFYR
jgi:hypothetical protein